MKKIICALIAIATVISMSACSSIKTSKASDTTASSEIISDTVNDLREDSEEKQAMVEATMIANTVSTSTVESTTKKAKKEKSTSKSEQTNVTATNKDSRKSEERIIIAAEETTVKAKTETIVQSNSGVSEEEIKALIYTAEDFGLLSMRLDRNRTNFDPTTADPKQLLTKVTYANIGRAYRSSDYFPNLQYINYNIEPDPLYVFLDTIYYEEYYYKIPQADIEWMLINVLNFSEKKIRSIDWTGYTSNPENDDWFTLYYCDGNFYFGGYVATGDGGTFELSSYEKRADGSYIIYTDYYYLYEYDSKGPVIFAEQKTINGRNILTITKVEI